MNNPLLAKLRLRLTADVLDDIPIQAKPHFLPGESRASCGPSGFRPLDVQEYTRRLYSNAEPRNLTPPQYLTPWGQITSERRQPNTPFTEIETGSDPHGPNLLRQRCALLSEEHLIDHYRCKFFLQIMESIE